MIDIYAQSYHRGLGGIPAKRWQEAIDSGFQPRLPTNARDLGIILGRFDTRVVHHYGIEFESIRYNSPALGPLRDRVKNTPVKIKYHPQDLSAIYVRDDSQRVYLTVPAIDQVYTSRLSLWKHRVIRRQALKEMGEVSHESLAQAQRKIRSIVSTSKQNASLRGRKRIARWERGGHPIGQQEVGDDQLRPDQKGSHDQVRQSTALIETSQQQLEQPDQTTCEPLVQPESDKTLLSLEDEQGGSMDGWGISYGLDDLSK